MRTTTAILLGMPCLIVPCFAITASEPPASLDAVRSFLADVDPLPKYEEAYYHPLGRSPVVDAVLTDPAYIVTYAKTVSGALRAAAASGSCTRVLDAALRGGAAPIGDAPQIGAVTKLNLPAAWDAESIKAVETAWSYFLEARRRSEAALAPLSDADKQWFIDHPDNYFFGKDSAEVNDFWTTNVDHILEIFTKCARVDLVELAEAQRLLAAAGDTLLAARTGLLACELDAPFVLNHDGVLLCIAGARNDFHTDDADFLIDLGGNDTYANNAGGTGTNSGASRIPAALAVDLAGDDCYEAGFGVQGAGFLGVGCLIDAGGDDVYRAGEYSQGSAWLGAGFVHDASGNDRYIGGYFVQSAAAFGFSVLWDNDGNDEYHADGMCQAASSTLGCAFLIDSRGEDRYVAGGPRRDRFTKAHSGAQGGVIGVRDYPWDRRPAFYAGVAFFDDAAGDDELYAQVQAHGGGYFLGAAIHVNSGGDDRYFCSDDSLGSTIHLAAAVCIKEGGNDTYHSQSCALGIGGDCGTGVFIDTGGNDRYRTREHSLGSSRKPHGYGMFIDAGGNDHYEYGYDSLAQVQRPASPAYWPRALFADLGGRDTYPADKFGLDRGEGHSWNFEGHGVGLDADAPLSESELFALFPKTPRGYAPFDPITGWAGNEAYRPLITEEWPMTSQPETVAVTDSTAEKSTTDQPNDTAPTHIVSPAAQHVAQAWIDAIPGASYDARRRLYERLNLLRSLDEKSVDWSIIAELLRDPAKKPDDQLTFAATWCSLDKNSAVLPLVADAITNDEITSGYTRRLLIRMIGEIDDHAGIDVLKDRLVNDQDQDCRRYAAAYLARRTPSDIETISLAIADESERVRWSTCRNVRDCGVPECLPLLQTLMRDESVFVRRQAALAAISLGDKAAVDLLLEDLKIESLDTGWNYGHNVFVDITPYMSERLSEEQAKELGVSLEGWTRWWHQNRDTITLLPKAKP